MMKKLVVERDADVAAIVDRIIRDPHPAVTLVVPRESVLKQAAESFEILAREVRAAKKTLVVESVDGDVLALAERAGLEAVHPLFAAQGGRRSLSDIVPHGAPPPSPPATPPEEKKPGHRRKLEVVEASPQEPEPQTRIDWTPPEFSERIDAEESPPAKTSRRRFLRVRGSKKALLLVVGILVIAGLGLWATSAFFGRAEVFVLLNATPWEWNGEFRASKAVANADSATRLLPGELLREKKNIVQPSPASGRAQVSQRATGHLTIWNAYSSEDQPLVASTRFETPDGKIFRLNERVVVPGAAITDGKIAPASIVVEVTADKPGPEYNVGPVAKLTVPGFTGSPKYTGFYGEFKEKTTGGFIGDRATPTDADIEKAKAKTKEILEAGLKSNVVNQRPADLRIVDGASAVTVTRLTVNKNTDDQGNFSVFGEAELRAVAFREGDLRAALLALAAKDRPNAVFKDLVLAFEGVKPNFETGEVVFTVRARGSLVPRLEADALRDSLLGLGVSEAEQALRKIPELREARISLWPAWVFRIPQGQDRVTVKVE